uniref:Uncharacterized protein n=1 Tax=Ochrobactrum phage ORM_20 TaxID=2985243 RepID=A0A9N6ZG92_9VIRU|nr:hypothetical protein ORM20_00080 [Ochrobactrum phage ORM_20]
MKTLSSGAVGSLYNLFANHPWAIRNRRKSIVEDIEVISFDFGTSASFGFHANHETGEKTIVMKVMTVEGLRSGRALISDDAFTFFRLLISSTHSDFREPTEDDVLPILKGFI